MGRSEYWYQTKLRRHFNRYFKSNSIINVEFYPDPAINQWKFVIYKLDDTKHEITLECNDTGTVTETRKKHCLL